MAKHDELTTEKRDDGRCGIKKPYADRSSAVEDTQQQAIRRAKPLVPEGSDGQPLSLIDTIRRHAQRFDVHGSAATPLLAGSAIMTVQHEVNILTYHSISDGTQPTCISPAVFREQMAILADFGHCAVSVANYAAWRRGELDLPSPFVVISFDDGYQDFATGAFPELQTRGWRCTIFLPAGKIGHSSDWDGEHRLPLMDWNTAARLAESAVELGAHGVTHTDLTAASADTARAEIVQSKLMIEDRAGCRVVSFAPPFGKSCPAIRDEIRRHYLTSVGTVLRRATPDSDLFDLPRIEMWYFRNPRRWRQYLERGSTRYFALRKRLRAVRAMTSS